MKNPYDCALTHPTKKVPEMAEPQRKTVDDVRVTCLNCVASYRANLDKCPNCGARYDSLIQCFPGLKKYEGMPLALILSARKE